MVRENKNYNPNINNIDIKEAKKRGIIKDKYNTNVNKATDC